MNKVSDLVVMNKVSDLVVTTSTFHKCTSLINFRLKGKFLIIKERLIPLKHHTIFTLCNVRWIM